MESSVPFRNRHRIVTRKGQPICHHVSSVAPANVQPARSSNMQNAAAERACIICLPRSIPLVILSARNGYERAGTFVRGVHRCTQLASHSANGTSLDVNPGNYRPIRTAVAFLDAAEALL